jgi:hypothetical protein
MRHSHEQTSESLLVFHMNLVCPFRLALPGSLFAYSTPSSSLNASMRFEAAAS